LPRVAYGCDERGEAKHQTYPSLAQAGSVSAKAKANRRGELCSGGGCFAHVQQKDFQLSMVQVQVRRTVRVQLSMPTRADPSRGPTRASSRGPTRVVHRVLSSNSVSNQMMPSERLNSKAHLSGCRPSIHQMSGCRPGLDLDRPVRDDEQQPFGHTSTRQALDRLGVLLCQDGWVDTTRHVLSH
jgi:hypothetical protein